MTGEPYQPFARESGVFVCASGDGDELRAHEQGGRWFFHRWRLIPHDQRDELVWRGPVAFGLTATEIYDLAEALRRQVDEKKGATTLKGKR